MQREDLSDFLVHFIKGETREEAFRVLSSIVRQSGLLGGDSYVKGSFRCVCFSEAPIHTFASFLARPGAHGVKYKPFGVAVRKRWLFEAGGRPVIYQSASEYYLLPQDIRWRHVRYEPHLEPSIDFTWEREWRIKIDWLAISPEVAWLVLPDDSWVDRLPGDNGRDQDPYTSLYSQLTGVPEDAWIAALPQPWGVIRLAPLSPNHPRA